jgi:hypothetical protein
MSETKCPNCGAELQGIRTYKCGSSAMDATQSAGCRIRELEAEVARLRADKERLKYVIGELFIPLQALRISECGNHKVHMLSQEMRSGINLACNIAIAAMKGAD